MLHANYYTQVLNNFSLLSFSRRKCLTESRYLYLFDPCIAVVTWKKKKQTGFSHKEKKNKKV